MASDGNVSDRLTVHLRVEPEQATRLNIGTRWEVAASSLESLWQGAYKITLEEIPAEDGGEKGAGRISHEEREDGMHGPVQRVRWRP